MDSQSKLNQHCSCDNSIDDKVTSLTLTDIDEHGAVSLPDIDENGTVLFTSDHVGGQWHSDLEKLAVNDTGYVEMT